MECLSEVDGLLPCMSSVLCSKKELLMTLKNGQYPTLHLNRDVAKEKLSRLIKFFTLASY